MVLTETHLTLAQMCDAMDTALSAEIKAQNTKSSGGHIAVNGTPLTKEGHLHLYAFSLPDPWEPQDDTPFRLKASGREIRGTIVSSTGTTITIATEEPLSPDMLLQVTIIDDPTQLLERLREALKNGKEGPTLLGSKCFGLHPTFPSIGKRSFPVTFGAKFIPDASQKRAIQTALGSEVTYIVGPPGTGKTLTLAAIAFSYLYEGKSILIAAHTNIAVGNAIMRLVDICRNTGVTDMLKQGRIIRYGTPQLEQRLKNEYKEVHLQTIVQQRVGNLTQRRQELQMGLNQIRANLTFYEQEKAALSEHWQNKRQQLVTQLKRNNDEHHRLQMLEKERITKLDERLQNLSYQISCSQQQIEAIRREQAQIEIHLVQTETSRMQQQQRSNHLGMNLTAATQMNPIKRLVKRMNPEKLALQKADADQLIKKYDQKLIELRMQKDEKYHTRVFAEKKLAELTLEHQEVTTQRNIPSPAEQKILKLDAAARQCSQELAHGDKQLRQMHEALEPKQQGFLKEHANLQQQLADCDKQLADVEKSIVGEARVIATTLCKTYMNSSLRERRFDVIILDEISMAPPPAVYVVASQADLAVVAIGDPKQLSPISQAEENSPEAKEWLASSLFDIRNITLEKASNGDDNSVLLDQQARMHPSISHIARTHIYQGRIIDRPRPTEMDYMTVEPLPDKRLLLCDTSDVAPIATKPNNDSRINTYHALCSVEIARQVLLTLPPPQKQLLPGEFRVGIVTPYRKQATLLQHLLQDKGLQNQVRAGTVHRFQGLEAEVIIFDTTDANPLPSGKPTTGQWGSSAMRLVNVAVTRAQHKLIIVADSKYICARFNEHDIMRLAVEEAQRSASLPSREILSSLAQQLQELQKRGKRSGVWAEATLDDLDLFDDRTFYDAFYHDVKAAQKRIIVLSPFLAQRAEQVTPTLKEKHDAGVRVTVIVSKDNERKPDHNSIKAIEQAGLELRFATGMHEKLVFIDDEVFYYGSLNALSHLGTTESMLRGKSPKFVQKLKRFYDVDSIIEIPVRWGQDIIIPQNELPKLACPECDGTLQIKHGKYGAFYGCSRYRACLHTEEIGEMHLRSVKLLQEEHCGQCGQPTRIKARRKDVWLECAAQNSCGYGRRIVISDPRSHAK